MNLKFKNLHLIFSILLFLLCVSASVFLYKEINKKNKKFEEINTIWETENKRREELRSLDKILKAVEPQRILLESHFIKSSDAVSFLNMLESLAIKAGGKTEITSVNIPSDKKSLEVNLKNTGSFQSVYKFLNLLENLPYQIDFDSVILNDTKGFIFVDKKTKILEWEGVFKIRVLTFVNV